MGQILGFCIDRYVKINHVADSQTITAPAIAPMISNGAAVIIAPALVLVDVEVVEVVAEVVV